MQRYQETKRALGSEAILTLIPKDSNTPMAAIMSELWQEISLFEATFSRFQPDSELTLVNHHAGKKTEVSPEFIALVSTAKDFAALTDDLYNPFILPTLQAAGYVGSWPEPDKASPMTDFRHRGVAPAEALEIGADWVRLPRGTALDFGGIGKGYLLDQLVELLSKRGLAGYWLSLGGDIICSGMDIDNQPWRIGLQQAAGPDIAGYVNNEDGRQLAVATSGITKRRGENWHHLIDPRTGEPATTTILTASVCMPTATEADVLAKCVVILGHDDGIAFISQHEMLGALVQSQSAHDTMVVELYNTGVVHL